MWVTPVGLGIFSVGTFKVHFFRELFLYIFGCVAVRTGESWGLDRLEQVTRSRGGAIAA